MQKIKKLIKTLKNKKRIFIQTHNYPDHDAVASAFALQYLLKSFKIDSNIIFHGDILRDSLQRMIDKLNIPILPHYKHELNDEDTIVIVDANKKKQECHRSERKRRSRHRYHKITRGVESKVNHQSKCFPLTDETVYTRVD